MRRVLVTQTGLKMKTIRKAVKAKHAFNGSDYEIKSLDGNVRLMFFGARETQKGVSAALFGRPERSLWRAASWYRFPRTSPAPGTVAVRRHHVFVLERHIGGSTWLVYDANSGRHRTHVHPRSIAGFTIVDPRAGA